MPPFPSGPTGVALPPSGGPEIYARRMAPPNGVPASFQRAVESFRAALEGDPERPELEFEEMPAPQRLAPHSAALSAAVVRDDAELAVGRLILLHDPKGRPGWDGGFRLVAYVRAELEPDIADDPLIGEVAWSWLTEALAEAGSSAESGTITRAVSESFGSKQDEPATTELELRASWSPSGQDMRDHVRAWSEVMCMAAGLPPRGVRDLKDVR
ncbi:DUF3000 domain-containing protein [Actinocorallia libanotica]|uniref:DUF3000 domain-containing protein n=2 Tax=Actinocorallia libanotica TaxID=46162 RepID=A0ABN1QDX7_9ACTN